MGTSTCRASASVTDVINIPYIPFVSSCLTCVKKYDYSFAGDQLYIVVSHTCSGNKRAALFSDKPGNLRGHVSESV